MWPLAIKTFAGFYFEVMNDLLNFETLTMFLLEFV